MFFKIGVRAVNKVFVSWPVFVRQSSKPLGHVESMLENQLGSASTLEGVWDKAF